MNLLPKTEKDFLKKGLKLRFTVVILMLLSLSFLVGFFMLFPSYFLTREYFYAIAAENSSAKIESEGPTKEILNLPEEIDSKLKLFQSSTVSLKAVDALSKIVGYLPGKVKLNTISFTRNQTYKGKNGIIILISGTALDRDSLVSFSTLLTESHSFASVDIPVSSLAKDKDLPFSISIFIKE